MDFITPAETYVAKLKVLDKHVYIKLIWIQNETDLFHIQVFDGDCSWSGRFSNEFADQFRKREIVNENEETYALNVKNGLSEENKNYTYEFTISLDEETASLSWKKRFTGINVLHGKVPVHRDIDPQPKSVLVDILLNKNLELKNDVKGLHTQTTKLVSELDKSKQELEKYVNIKTSLETTLYGRFVQLLNAKKRRIQLLEDNLLNFEEPNNISMNNELD